MLHLIRVVDRMATPIERLSLALAGIAIVAMMVLVTASALGRHVFNSPITGSEVWVGVFLAPLATYLALASALTHRSHVGVTILVQRSGRRMRRLTQISGAWIVCATFAVLAWQGGLRTWEAFTSGQVEHNIGLPLWMAYVVVPIGCTGIALRAALLALRWWMDGEWRISLAQREATADEAEREQHSQDATSPHSG